MTQHDVVFAPEAEEQLAELYRYIAENATAEVALRYTSARSSRTAKDWRHSLSAGHRVMTYAPACGLRRTSGVRKSPTRSKTERFRSSECSTVAGTTRPRYSRRRNRKIEGGSLGSTARLSSPGLWDNLTRAVES